MILLVLAYSAKVVFLSSTFYFKGDTLFTEVTKRVEILDPVGAGRYGSERIIFDNEKESVEIIYARTIQPDGKIVSVTENARNIVTPYVVSDYPEYSNIRELVVSFLDLNKGSVTDIKYVKKTYRGGNKFSKVITFASGIPVDKRIVKIKPPPGRELKYQIRGDITLKKDGSVYTFEMDSIPAIPYEEDQPPLSFFAPTIFVSMEEWKEIVDEFRPILDIEKDSTKIEVKNPLKWIRSNIELIDAPDSITGRSTRSVEEIIKSGRGTIYERAKVLCSLLSRMKKRPELVLVFDRYTFNKDLPIDAIDGILVKTNGLYMNVEDVKYSSMFLYDFSGEPAMVINRDTFNYVILPEDPDTFNTIEEEIYIEPGKRIFRVHVLYGGIYGAQVRNFYEENQDKLKEKIQDAFFSMGKVQKFSFENIDSLTHPIKLNVEGIYSPVFQGNFTILNLPQAGLSLADFYYYNVEQNRTTPVYISENSLLSFDYRIKLGGMDTYVTPEDREIKNGLYEQKTSVRKNNGLLVVHKRISFKRGIVPVDGTPDFKDFLERWRNPGQSIVILNKK